MGGVNQKKDDIVQRENSAFLVLFFLEGMQLRQKEICFFGLLSFWRIKNGAKRGLWWLQPMVQWLAITDPVAQPLDKAPQYPKYQ